MDFLLDYFINMICHYSSYFSGLASYLKSTIILFFDASNV